MILIGEMGSAKKEEGTYCFLVRHASWSSKRNLKAFPLYSVPFGKEKFPFPISSSTDWLTGWIPAEIFLRLPPATLSD